MTLPINFKNSPSNSRQNPATNNLPIQVRPSFFATRDRKNAMNQRRSAIFRIIAGDYTASLYAEISEKQPARLEA